MKRLAALLAVGARAGGSRPGDPPSNDWHSSEPRIYVDLVDHLHANQSSVIGGAIGGVALAWISHSHNAAGGYDVMLATMAIVGIARVICLAYYSRRIAGQTVPLATTRKWEFIYTTGAWGYAALFGIFSIMVFMDDQTSDLRTLTAATTVGYAGGIAGRNAGRPLVALGQVIFACLPLALFSLLMPAAAEIGLGILLVIFMITLGKIIVSLNAIVAQAFIKERDVGEMNERLDAAITHMMNGLCMVDAQGKIQVMNDRFARLLCVPERGLVYFHEFLVLAFGRGTLRHADMQLIQSALSARTEASAEFTTAMGVTIVLKIALTPAGGQIITIDDVTERTRAVADIERMAKFDTLTGLANRASIIATLNHSINATDADGLQKRLVVKAEGQARSRPDQAIALLLIDLDRFKEVNDTLGHDAGDQLLVKVGERLSGLVGPGDIVGRLGGDEFVVLRLHSGAREAEAMAQRIVRAMATPFDIGGRTVLGGATIGIALSPTHGRDGASLMKAADIALYVKKAQGGNGSIVFDAEMAETMTKKLALELSLTTAIREDRLGIRFQPIVHARTRELIAFEALARWTDAETGIVPPDVFVPMAERLGLIEDLGAAILMKACREAVHWPASVRVSVNVSPIQFRDRNRLFGDIERALNASGLSPERLDIEVTESVLIKDAAGMLEIIRSLRSRGISVSLDDFGTGYSSLAYLQDFPFDKIKLDKVFARSIEQDRTTRATIAALANIAATTGSRLLLEGVETEAQARIALAHGVDEIQGFLIAKPLVAVAAMAFQGLTARRDAARNRHEPAAFPSDASVSADHRAA